MRQIYQSLLTAIWLFVGLDCLSTSTYVEADELFAVTLSVDMSLENLGSNDVVYVNGTNHSSQEGGFGEWCGSCIAMNDLDGDKIWTITHEVPAGTYSYKFTVNGWDSQEAVPADCRLTSGQFVNRQVVVNADTVVPTTLYSGCLADTESEPENSANNSSNLLANGMFDSNDGWSVVSLYDSVQDGHGAVTIAGGSATFSQTVTGDWTKHLALYTAVELEAGVYAFDMDVSYNGISNVWGELYISTSTPVPGEDFFGDQQILNVYNTWSCSKIVHTGKATATGCDTQAVPGQFSVDASGTYYLVFKSGGNSYGTSGIVLDNWHLAPSDADFSAQNYAVSLSVDMSSEPLATTDTVYVNGTRHSSGTGGFGDWCGDCIAMNDDDGDNIWRVDLNVPSGSYEYKFTINGWESQESVPADCGVTTDQFVNRQVTVVADVVLPTTEYSGCAAQQPGGPIDPEGGYMSPDSYSGYQLAWADEFSGNTLNTADWTHEIGTGSNGWGNNELQYYRSQNTRITNGKLVIEAREENFAGRAYTSSRIITLNKQFFQYGRIDIRAKTPRGQGLWPALWMLGENISSIGWPKSGEIDIMEMVGGSGRERDVHGTAHWNRGGANASYAPTNNAPYNGGPPNSYRLAANNSLDATFHVFSLEWTENALTWFIDNVPFNTMVIDNSVDLAPFRKEFFFIFNVAVGGDWPGSPDPSTVFPQRMLVDYVRVFQKSDVVDIDADGIADDDDNCVDQANANQVDTDSDGFGNVCDDDDDNDGVVDLADAFPLLSTETRDTDLDSIGDNADTDDDGDGILDEKEVRLGTDSLRADSDADGTNDLLDVFPLDSFEWLDDDGDGVGNNADVFDSDPLEWFDTDANGVGNNSDTDDDGDGYSDLQEVVDGTDSLNALDCKTCPSPVSGLVYHWRTQALLASVDLALVGLDDGAENAFSDDAVTNTSGSYAFAERHGGTNRLTVTKAMAASESENVISSADALAALKIAVGINPNADPDGAGPREALPVSPYQYIAADVTGDGRVTSADALDILKMAVKLSSAQARRWLFVSEDYDFWDETANDGDGAFKTTRADVDWEPDGIIFEYPESTTKNIVGILMGDVNGDWSEPAGSARLGEDHLSQWLVSFGESLAQWGLSDTSGADDFDDAPPDTNTFPDVTWESSAPNDVNVDKEGIDQALDYAFSPGRNTQGVVIIRHGVIIGERYADGESKHSLATSWSTGKSFASALIGIALDRDFIDSIDVPAETYLTSWMDTNKGDISIRAILEMRSGLKQSRAEIYSEGNQLAFALARVPETTPRTDNWAYQNEDSMLLAGILEAATGQSVLDFADINLFSKIGMQADWWTDAHDHALTYCCIDATSRDFARFGLLYARNGRWFDDQIIPENWVKESTTAPEGSVTRNYAMQWWVRPTQGYFMALGLHDNNIYVFQDQDLVIVRNSLYTKVGSSSVRTGGNYHQTQPPSTWSHAVFLSYITNAIND